MRNLFVSWKRHSDRSSDKFYLSLVPSLCLPLSHTAHTDQRHLTTPWRTAEIGVVENLYSAFSICIQILLLLDLHLRQNRHDASSVLNRDPFLSTFRSYGVRNHTKLTFYTFLLVMNIEHHLSLMLESYVMDE